MTDTTLYNADIEAQRALVDVPIPPDLLQQLESGAKQKYSDDQPRDEAGRWTDGGSGDSSETQPLRIGDRFAWRGSGLSSPKFLAQLDRLHEEGWTLDPRDDKEANFDFASQVGQFPETGTPGITFKVERLTASMYVDAVTYRDAEGKLKGVLYHYPQDIPPYEQKGNINVLVDKGSKRQGIATKLLLQAGRRFTIHLDKQDYTAEGRKFVMALVHNGAPASLAKSFLKYSEDQPRDEAGRWTEGDGGSAAGIDEARWPAHGPIESLHVDNPGGEWLRYEQEHAREMMDTGRSGLARVAGAVTASLKTTIDAPWLAQQRGLMDEHLRIDEARVERLAGLIRSGELDLTKNRVFVNVSYNGQVWINEGNHRAQAAVRAGLTQTPVEVRYYAGGEQADGPLKLGGRKALKYSEDQPRDEAGRWTSGGEGAGETGTHPAAFAGATTYETTGERMFKTTKEAEAALGKIVPRTIHSAPLGDTDLPHIMVGNNPPSLRAAYAAAEVLAEMKEKGYAMPDRLQILAGSGPGSDSVSGTTQQHTGVATVTMILNIPMTPAKTHSLDAVTRATFSRHGISGHRTAVATTYRDVIVHEMGHVQDAHEAEYGWERQPTFADVPRGPRGTASTLGEPLEKATHSVSQYAHTNADEFRAEAFAAQYKGEALSASAKKLYTILKGPKVR